MKINEDFGFRAHHPLSLRLSKQLITVDAPVQCALLVLKEYLELLHVDLTHQLVLLVLQDIQIVDGNLLGQLLHQRAVQAVHVNRQTDYLVDISCHEKCAILYEMSHLEEIR